MGVVYKAEDTRLERPVALKFLNLVAETGDDSKARFEREARAAAALDHPNICTIYEIDEAEGRPFIAMAFLEGDTVQELVQKSPLAIDDVLELGSQAAKGLAAAHEKGVVHRDIKSANLMVVRASTGSEPQLKIMDFGLAQLTAGASKLTQDGSTLGTAAYMSPEQSRGEKVDERTDLWSLGAVLYEMLTSQMPFRGEYQQAVVYSILHEAPQPITALRSGVDLELERIVFKALQKTTEDRYQNAVDLLVDLRALKKQRDSGAAQMRPSAFVTAVTPPATVDSGERPASADSVAPAPPLPRWRRYGLLGAAAVLLVALGALASRLLGPYSPIDPSLPPVVTPITSDEGTESFAAFSPDGSQIAFVWDGPTQDNFDIYIRVVDEGGQPLRLTSDPASETSPAWSPDGRSIAFVRQQRQESAVFLIPPIGGSERRLSDITVRGRLIQDRLLGWSPDGRTLAIVQQGGAGQRDAGPDGLDPPAQSAAEGGAEPAPDAPLPGGREGPRRQGIPGGILLHDVASGQSRLLYLTDVSDDRRSRVHSPTFSPNGARIAFVWGAGPLAGDIYVMPVEGGGTPQRITNDESLIQGLVWSEDGSIIFSSERGRGATRLWRAKVGPLGGAVLPLLGPGENATLPAVAKQGRRLAYTRSELDINIWQLDVGHGREMMKPKAIIVSTRLDHSPQFSLDGRRIAFVSDRSGYNELWVADADGSNAVKLTSYGGPTVAAPSWSPDGNEIAMQVINGSRFDVDVVPVNGSTTRRLTTGNASGSLPFWSHDSEWIYVTLREDGLCKIPARGGEVVHESHRLAAEGGSAQESMDGTLLYFAKRGFGGGLWQIPVEGGTASALPRAVMPAGRGRWAVTEKGIFFVDRDRNLKVYHTGTGQVATLTTMEPEAMQYPGPGFSVSPDGMSVLYVRVDRSEADLMLVENYR